MKTKMNIKSIIIIAVICILSLFFINKCFAANTGKILVETAKLREEPNTDSKILELASVGEEVEILDEADQWYKVKYKKITGYIRSDLIEVDNKEEANVVNNNVEASQNITAENTIIENEVVENEVIENEVIENTTTETNTEPVEEKSIEKGKYKVTENVKLKIIPLISAIEFEEISKDTEVEVTEILNDWAKIKISDETQGWIRTDKLVSEQLTTTEVKPEETTKKETTETSKQNTNTTKIMYVNSQTVNVRQQADKTSNVIKQLSINCQVTVLSTENGWANIEIDGIKGYIAENLLSTTKQETSRSSTTARDSTTNTSTTNNTSTKDVASNAVPATSSSNAVASGKGTSVVSYAKQFLGCKYVYGGTSTSGFDCSGFTQYVYKHFGVSLNRTAAAQYSNGTSVTNLQAGDLVMFGKSGINHVGIYIGGNTFIHAANPSRGVTTDTLATGYYKTNYVGARRIF